MTWYCGEGAGGTGCLPDLLPDKCHYLVAPTQFSSEVSLADGNIWPVLQEPLFCKSLWKHLNEFCLLLAYPQGF